MREIFATAFLMLMVWGCLAVIAGHYGIGIYPPFDWLIFLLHFFAPWVTPIAGYRLWKECRTWRLLNQARNQPSPLTRDPQDRPAPTNRPHVMERIAVFMMVIGGVSLIYWFDLPGPEFYLAAGLLVWFFKNFVFRVLRRRGRG